MIVKKVLGVKSTGQKFVYLPAKCDIQVGELVVITKLVIPQQEIRLENIEIPKQEETEKELAVEDTE